MIRSELVEILNSLPDIEVGDMDVTPLLAARVEEYDDDSGTHEYIFLEFEGD